MDFSALFSQVWPLAALLLVAGPLIMRGAAKRRDARRRAGARQASSLGMDYQPPPASGHQGVLDEGTHRFSGTTRGIEWQCETLLLSQTDSDTGASNRRIDRLSHTRWTASGYGTGGGALMLMNPPGGVVPAGAPATGGGLLAGLAEKAGGVALRAFAAACFGAAKAGSLPLQPGHRLPAPADDFGRAFYIFADEPGLLKRINPEVRALLLEARDEQIAMLWDVQGLTLNWPTPATSPEAVARTAEFGAAIAAGLSRRGMLA